MLERDALFPIKLAKNQTSESKKKRPKSFTTVNQ